MANIPLRVQERLVSGIKRFQGILGAAKTRDAGEADTSTIVKDILSDMFGYDKYTEITSEFMIKGTYCDLAIKMEKLIILVEVKAIGIDLKDAHVKQAVDYAANKGVDWVILTNGVSWRIYRVFFEKPIGQEMVFECDLLAVNARNKQQVEALYLFAREGHRTDELNDYAERRQALSRHNLAAVILTEPMLDLIRREVRRLAPNIKVSREDIEAQLLTEVLKRDVIEGEKAEEARRRIRRSQGSSIVKPRARPSDEEMAAAATAGREAHG